MTDVPIKFMKWSVFDKEGGYRDDIDGSRKYMPHLPPGAAYWSGEKQALHFICPCGCGAHHAVPTVTPDKHKPDSGWMWNADVEKPTLLPSLGINPKDGKATDGSGFHWHGYLTDGVFKPC